MPCYHDRWHPNHHLIYREELKRDGEEEEEEEEKKKAVCSWCHKPIWGSFYSCVECCNQPVHVSSYEHCLDFTEKLENDGNKKVCCFGCDEPVLGAAYKCSISECSFLIHKSCTELSYHINHHLHPNHTLSLQTLNKNRCDTCCRSHDRSFFYRCTSCSFKLDIKCAHNPLSVNPNDCHQHEFFSLGRRIQFNCDACGEEITNLAYKVCSICKLLVHYRCAEIPRKVKIKLHNHILNLIYSLPEIKKHDDTFCRICYEKVNIQYAAYYCQECSYIFHTECLRRFRNMYGELPTTSESVPNKSVGHATHLIKALNQAEDEGPHLGEIQHFSHQQHKLIIYSGEIKNDMLCQGCMELIISAPFYGCVECNFFIHTRCTKLPTRIEQHRLDLFHTLTLLPRASTKSGVFFCDICSRHHHGFTYECNTCFGGKTLDVQCGSIPEILKHEGHQHSLYLALDSHHRKCKACPKDNEEYVFVCISCNFILGIRCANLPLVARHKYDTHLLKLTYSTTVKYSGEYYCLICEEERDPNHWFYYCEECDFPAHPECVLEKYQCMVIGSTHISEYHQHPLTFAKIDQDSRSTYVSEYYRHPFSLFMKTENSPKCQGCGELLDGVALECSQCKFSVHPPRPYFPDCLWKLSNQE
ncbi:uncharacterized protein LOC132174391 [Corylus avellana]|uniref:uncharacterized protein LOC132174391 n=1 Tax=Corylus avellana TaxID=13451 RepID=UPI001E201761|nr:uncharacterized protein LOC132174391 [Corylus avellana]